MAEVKSNGALHGSLDASFLLSVLQSGLLAASPHHAVIADPFLYGPLEIEETVTPFLCSHVPDIHVGEPVPIVLMSNRYPQGVKC